MGCYRLQVEKVGKNREEATVLLHLISKAERRKRAAENFHVYAMLQSTILRLKLDDHVVKMRNLTYRNKRCMSTNFSSSIDGSLIKRFPDVSVSDVTDVCTIDKDPLNLDSFFDKLKAS